MCRARSLSTRWLFAILVTTVLLPAIPTSTSASAQQAAPLGQMLADRYAPIGYLRTQSHPCATPPGGGEPYVPLPVEMVLDNPRVLVRNGADGDKVLATGVSAQQLATFGPETYLDFPGDPRRPGCTYETDERARIEEIGLKPTTYAHIVFDEAGHRLALQYWFYWYFNDWNNTHESDWEMIQLMWDDVASVEQALDQPPTRIGYSQHGNGELATWGDPKIQLEDGTHPHVYPAAGSHATFFSNDTFLAWGERNSGFGCDMASPPSVRTPLDVVLVPDTIDPQGDFAWLLYPGRWGERQPAAFNGPLGAGFNSKWSDPWETSDNWRPFSIVVPGSKAIGPTMTDAFCGMTAAGSQVLMYAVVYPWATLPLIIVVVGAFVFFFRRSRDLLGRAIRVYRSYWRVLVGIGLTAIPVGIVFNIIQSFLIHRDPLEFVIEWFDDTAGAKLTAVLAVGGVQQLAMILIIGPTVIEAVADIHRGNTPGVLRAFRLAASKFMPIALAGLVILVLAGGSLLLIIGLPVAIWLVVRWQFFAQALIFDDRETVVGSLRTSSRLVRGRWWKTLFAVLIFDLLATVPGVVVGFGLLTLGGTAVGFANSISSLLYALTIPVSVIAVTLMFLDYRGDPLRIEPEPETDTVLAPGPA